MSYWSQLVLLKVCSTKVSITFSPKAFTGLYQAGSHQKIHAAGLDWIDGIPFALKTFKVRRQATTEPGCSHQFDADKESKRAYALTSSSGS